VHHNVHGGEYHRQVGTEAQEMDLLGDPQLIREVVDFGAQFLPQRIVPTDDKPHAWKGPQHVARSSDERDRILLVIESPEPPHKRGGLG